MSVGAVLTLRVYHTRSSPPFQEKTDIAATNCQWKFPLIQLEFSNLSNGDLMVLCFSFLRELVLHLRRAYIKDADLGAAKEAHVQDGTDAARHIDVSVAFKIEESCGHG